MAKPDLFKELQDTLRTYKNEHNVDLSHNQGATIHGKTYPAMHKLVFLDLTKPGNQSHNKIDLHIPLENGHRVSIRNRYDDHKLIYLQEFPTKYMHGDGNFHHGFHSLYEDSHESIDATADQMGFGILERHNNNPEDFHNIIKRFSKAPSTGFRATTNSHQEDYKLQMNQEELQAAHKALTGKDEVSLFKKLLPPHIIGVWGVDHSTTIHPYTGLYHYNTNTEQLRKVEESS